MSVRIFKCLAPIGLARRAALPAVLATTVALSPALAHAESAQGSGTSVGFTAGLGQSVIQSAEKGKGSYTESPFAFGFSVDHILRESYFVFVEHLRTYGLGSTGVGLTGFGFKYYPWLTPAHFRSVTMDDGAKSATLSIKGYAPYFGASGGFAQASIPAVDKNPSSLALGFYADLKLGIELPMSARWGVKGEANLAQSFVGSGSVQYVSCVAGLYYTL